MPDLYRLSVGPIGAAYYQQQFGRFEMLGKTVPSWNHGAAFFTLAWLLLRQMWRPAALYSGVWLVLASLWVFGIHGRLPVQVEATVCLLALLLLCAIPGFLANGWYYHQVRSHTLNTLTQASSIGQARAKLAKSSISKEHLHIVAAGQAIVSLALAGLLYYYFVPANTPATVTPSGPPTLVIPTVASLQDISPLSADSPAAVTTEARTEPSATTTTTTTSVTAHDTQPASAADAENSAPAPTTAAVADAANTAVTAAAPRTAPAAAAPPPPPAPAKNTASATPSKTPAKPVSKTPATSPIETGRMISGKYYLNAGVYSQTSNVDRAVKQLNAAKLNTLRHTVSSNKGELTRLRIGPFDTRKQAEQAAASAKKLRIDSTVFQQP